MVSTPAAKISRREFLVAAGLTATTACLAPGVLADQSEDVLVPTAFKVATTAKITVQLPVGAGKNGNISTRNARDRFMNPFVSASVIEVPVRVRAWKVGSTPFEPRPRERTLRLF